MQPIECPLGCGQMIHPQGKGPHNRKYHPKGSRPGPRMVTNYDKGAQPAATNGAPPELKAYRERLEAKRAQLAIDLEKIDKQLQGLKFLEDNAVHV